MQIQAITEIVQAVVRNYETFLLMCLRWRDDVARQVGPMAVRKNYYAIKREKWALDRLILDWRVTKDWRKRDEWQEEDNKIRSIHFALQREMQLIQKEYRQYLFDHQDKIFPVKGKRSELTDWQELLWKLHVDPEGTLEELGSKHGKNYRTGEGCRRFKVDEMDGIPIIIAEIPKDSP